MDVADGRPVDAAEPPEAPPPRTSQPPLGAIPEELVDLAVSVRAKPLPQRIAAISEGLLGRPYFTDPLGEGQGWDADPFARYDVFDCLTYVEEVLALSLAGDPVHAAHVRDALRYGDRPRTYVHRRHFMELQWIPGNLADGWLVDTTREYGPTIRLEREVTAETWAGWKQRNRFAHTDDELPRGVMALDVLSLDVALDVHDRIRPGSIVLTVREDRPWIPLWVTHVGFVVEGDRPLFRHATRLGGGGSKDNDLAWYLEHIRSYGPWKTLGIAVLEPVEQGPRRAALTP